MRRPSLKRVRIIRGIKTLGNIKKGGFAMAGKNNSKTIINLKGKERKNLKDNLSISEYGLSHVDEFKDLRITSEELQEIDEMSNDIVSTEELLKDIACIVQDMERNRIILEMIGYMDAERWNLFISMTNEFKRIYQEVTENERVISKVCGTEDSSDI